MIKIYARIERAAWNIRGSNRWRIVSSKYWKSRQTSGQHKLKNRFIWLKQMF